MLKSIVYRKARSAFVRFRRSVVSARFGASPDQIYGTSFYDGGGFARTDETAAAITSYLLQRYGSKSVLDLGCGMGSYLSQFAASGCRAVGVEGSSAGLKRVPDVAIAMQHDLRVPLLINQRFDLVMSVEVAEHIPRKYSRTLVKSICRHAKGLVVFTAAPPGTPGDDHINCRERKFWDELFEEQGFSFNEVESQLLKEFASSARVARWFQEWAYVYTSDERGRG